MPFADTKLPDITGWQIADGTMTNGFKLRAATLILDGTITYRIKYEIDTSVVTGVPRVEYTYGNKVGTVEPVYNSSEKLYFAEVNDICPYDMDEKVRFVPYYESGDEKVCGTTLQYGAYVYLVNQLNKNPTGSLKDLLEATATYIYRVDLYFK